MFLHLYFKTVDNRGYNDFAKTMIKDEHISVHLLKVIIVAVNMLYLFNIGCIKVSYFVIS